MHTRKEVYNLLQTEMQTQDKIGLEAGSSKPCHILAGDMNAALYMDDGKLAYTLRMQCTKT